MEAISLEQLHEQWPQDDSGKLCARLLQRYCYARLVDSAQGNESTESRAQAESAASKVMATFTKDFAKLASPPAEPVKRSPMKKLHRFDTPKPSEPNPRSSEKK